MIVLTGGSGFIGSCFLRKLNDEGINDVLVVDHIATTDKWKNLLKKRFSGLVHKNDFLSKLYENKYTNIEAIIHLGACSSTTERNSDYLLNNNYEYSVSIAKYSADKDIRFIYASSAATYGDGTKGYSDEDFYTLEPLNGYGFSKHIFDLWVLDNKLDKQFVGIKYFNVFGPNEYHKGNMSSMVFKSYNQIVQNGYVNLFKSNNTNFADGNQRRDFIYVKDCNTALWKFLNNKTINGIFNLGTGKSRTWIDLVNACFASLAKIDPKYSETKINYIDMPESISEQYQNYTQADMSKFKKCNIDFVPTELEDSVNDYISNYLSKNYSIY